MTKIDREFFFKEVRARPFGGDLQQRHVDGCNAILNFWEDKYSDKDDRWIAYALGTAYHETAYRMEAINEYGGPNYFNARYGPGTPVGRVLGNTEAGDGNRFRGRGFVQLTGRANYADWSGRLGVDLLADPNKVLDTEVAARILVEGSVLGTFTGVKFSNYLNSGKDDWFHARQIINRLDKARRIADYGKQFWAAISYEGTGQVGQADHRPILREGADGEDVRFLQRYLGLHPDGGFGPMTDDVVRAFQDHNGLSVDGIVGRASWSKLLTLGLDVRDAPDDSDTASSGGSSARGDGETGSSPIPVGSRPLLKMNSRGDAVKELQSLLGISDDGIFGSGTLEEVKNFQRNAQLQADGIVGPATWLALLNQ